MAKKSKARKSKSKTSQAKKVTPTYLREGTSFTMGLHDVVRALKVIEKHRHLDQFVGAAKRAKASVLIDADSVNFVKDFMVKYRMHDDPVGKHIVNARVERRAPAAVPGPTTTAAPTVETAAQDPFRPCRFRRGG